MNGNHTLNGIDTFDEALAKFIAGAQDMINKSYEGNMTRPNLSMEKGKRYIRIVQRENWTTSDGLRGGSAWAFIDTTNGDVLKPASWKTPAKHRRGNIFSPKNGLEYVTAYGPAYLR